MCVTHDLHLCVQAEGGWVGVQRRRDLGEGGFRPQGCPVLTLPVSDPVSVRKPRYVRRERRPHRDVGPSAVSSVEARVSNV